MKYSAKNNLQEMFMKFLEKMRTHVKGLSIGALLLLKAAPVFAAGSDIMPSGLTSLAESIEQIFTGGFVKAILVIILSGCAVAYAFNKDNEKMKRNIIAIAVGAAILVVASSVLGKVMDAANT
jgi:type IV secretory pathway VirB2 component (pilin)